MPVQPASLQAVALAAPPQMGSWAVGHSQADVRGRQPRPLPVRAPPLCFSSGRASAQPPICPHLISAEFGFPARLASDNESSRVWTWPLK